MGKMKFLFKFIASIEICFVVFPVKNPAVVCHDSLKTCFTLAVYSSVPGVCVINFILFIYSFLVMICRVLTEMPPNVALLSDYTKGNL